MKFCDEKIQKHLLNGGKIKRESCDFLMFLSNNGLLCYQSECHVHTCCINKKDLTADDWEIVKPEYDWDKIIKDKALCVFYNANEDYKLGYIRKIWGDGLFQCNVLGNGILHIYDMKNCKPFNPAEFNIAKDLKEYEK